MVRGRGRGNVDLRTNLSRLVSLEYFTELKTTSLQIIILVNISE